MTEETASVETEQATVSPFNTDGTFADGWQKQLTDESLHEDQTLATIKDVNSLAKSYVHVRKQVPLDKMPRPNDNWGDEDWGEFHKAGGRPDTAADYGIARPDEIPEEVMSKEMIDGYQELFHKIGLSKKQSDAISAYNNEKTVEAINNQTQQAEMDFNTLSDGLRNKWGMAFDQKSHLGNIAIEKGMKGDLDFKDRLIEKINKDPDLIEFASNLGGLFGEHGIVEDSNIPTPADTESKIHEAMGMNLSGEEAKMHPYQNAKHPQHERQVQLVRQLVESKNKKAK